MLEELVLAIKNSKFFGDKIFVCGNGGDLSLAQHFTTDMNKFTDYTVYCLGSNPAYITAIANDLSYEDIFVEEFKKYAGYRNILILLSTSGESKNILKLLEYANEVDDMTYGITGHPESTLAKKARRVLVLTANTTAEIEDKQSELLHKLAEELK